MRKSIEVYDGIEPEVEPLFRDITFKLDRVILDGPGSRLLNLLANQVEPDKYGTRLRHYPELLGLEEHWPNPDEVDSVTIKKVVRMSEGRKITQVILFFEVQY